MLIGKQLRFEAAHVLPKHPGKCSRLHGHTYLLEIWISGQVDADTGMVIDFSVLSGIIEEHVFKFVDHTFLNEVFTALSWPGETTAENIARFIWRQLVGPISQQNCYLHRIKLWETANYFVEVDYTIELEHGVEPIDLGEDEEPEDDESPA